MNTDAEYLRLANEVIRWSDLLRGRLPYRDYAIAAEQYDRAKRAFDDYVKTSDDQPDAGEPRDESRTP